MRGSKGRAFCPHCGYVLGSEVGSFCPSCGVAVRWAPDNSVELRVTGEADEVKSVAGHLVANLPPVVTVEHEVDLSPVGRDRWAKVGRVWAFAIGLATVVGGVAAVLALIH